MESKVAVLGDVDFVMPFSALGLDTYAVGVKAGEISKRAEEIINGKYGLVVVAENIARQAEEVFGGYANETLPCIVVVPFTTEPEGFAAAALGKVLRMATGINILKNN